MGTPRQGQKLDPAAAPGTFARLMVGWDAWMRLRNFSPCTNAIRLQSLGLFATWMAERSVTHAAQVTRPMVEAYQSSLTRHIKANGEPMAISGQYQRMRGVAAFFSWCHRKGHITANPAADLELPRLFKPLPHHLTRDEIDRVLAAASAGADAAASDDGPDADDGQCLRDRALLELFYSTGLRRAEAARLRVDDLDALRGLVRVTRGKGGKDRVVPIGARALDWLDRYIRGPRARWCVDHGEYTLFLTPAGTALDLNQLARRVRRILTAAGITKPGACHLFRHTFATHLMDNGCELRLIQGMLGHAGPEMSARYAQVTARALIAAHRLYHPADGGDAGPGGLQASAPPASAEHPQP